MDSGFQGSEHFITTWGKVNSGIENVLVPTNGSVTLFPTIRLLLSSLQKSLVIPTQCYSAAAIVRLTCSPLINTFLNQQCPLLAKGCQGVQRLQAAMCEKRTLALKIHPGLLCLGCVWIHFIYSQGNPGSQLSTSRSIKARIRGDKCRLLG